MKEKEIEFCELLYSHDALIENLIPANIDSPHSWNLECKCMELYNFQYLFLNYAMMYADDFKLSARENWQRKLGAGQLYNIGARNSGKSLIGLDCDTIFDPFWLPGSETIIASFDDKHLAPRTDRVAQIVESHPFWKIFHLKGQKKTVTRGAKFKVHSLNGTIIKAANEKSHTPHAGIAFEGMHGKILRYDEAQQMSEQGTKKRIDSVSPLGAFFRFAGIPELIIGSSLGKLLANPNNKNWIVRLPQYVLPTWSDKMKKQRIEEFDGEHSLGYRLNVIGELIEGALGKWDMERIRNKCLKVDKSIKVIEISKQNFEDYSTLLSPITSIPCDTKWISSDIGTTGSASEIIIHFGFIDKDKQTYKYVYNIPLHNLTTQEQAEIFKCIYDNLGGAFISLDCTSDGGRAIADELVILGIPDENITRCMFNSLMVIGFEVDENGKVKRDTNGNPLEKKEKTIDWACQRLEYILYNGLMEIPYDPKFLKEFSSYLEIVVGNQKRYGSSSTDHLHQSFQCWAIAQFMNEFKLIKIKSRKKRTLGIIE